MRFFVVFFVSVFVLSNTSLLYAQTSPKEIDDLVEKARGFSLSYKSDEALKIGMDVLKKSIVIKYNSGIILGNTIMAFEFRNTGNYGESLEHVYAIWGQFKDSVDNNPKLNATLLTLIGDNYLEIGLKKEAIQIGRNMIQLADRFKNKDEAFSYKRAGYGLIYSCYKHENRDSVYHYLMQAKYWEDAMEKLTSPKSKLLGRSTLSFSIANYYIDYTTHYDSAYFYINKGIARRGSANPVPYKSDQLIGKILIKEKKYTEAYPYLVSALKDAQAKKKVDEITSIYKLTAELYGGMGNKTLAGEFQKKMLLHTDSVRDARRANIQIAVELVKSEVYNEMLTKQHRIFWYWVSGGTILIFAIGGYFFWTNRRARKQSSHIHSNFSNNEAFAEIITLAKNNDPAFLGRFKEVYPQFCEELIERFPGMLNSELAFCAYLKLNFTTKDIAAYTFVTPSAVRNRKNRMKKKFDIPVRADIYAWIDKIPKS